MHISWHGYHTTKISSGNHTIVLDPYSPDMGLSPFRSKADMVILSNAQDTSMSHTKGIQGDFSIIDQPGEYSFNGLSLYGKGWLNTKNNAEQTMFRLHLENLVILYLGALNRKLNQSELQELEQSNIDILLVPIGGSTTINTNQALDLVSTIEPNVVIPTNYSLPKTKSKLDTISKFANEMGVNPKKPEKKIIVSANKIDHENITALILAP